jgi:tripartite-type tricarboxylate transporter receptor subunit TctC
MDVDYDFRDRGGMAIDFATRRAHSMKRSTTGLKVRFFTAKDPTVAEFVPGYEASAWHGIGAPKNTPTEIIVKLNEEINAGLADPKMKARLDGLGARVLIGSPADFAKFIEDETDKWAKVTKFAGIKPD